MLVSIEFLDLNTSTQRSASLRVPAVAHADRKFESPSSKIEFYSPQAEKLGLPPLPVHMVDKTSPYPLALSFGRTPLTHFHSFYDEGRAPPSLAKHNAGPPLWISGSDSDARQLSNGDAIRIYNERGEFGAKRTLLTTCRRRWSGLATDGSVSIISHDYERRPTRGVSKADHLQQLWLASRHASSRRARGRGSSQAWQTGRQAGEGLRVAVLTGCGLQADRITRAALSLSWATSEAVSRSSSSSLCSAGGVSTRAGSARPLTRFSPP